MKAFPTTKPLDSWGDPNQGMDLRDYFAAKVIINGAFSANTNVQDPLIAKRAYEIADAMMKAREE
jgi:hypothetical protein